MKIVTVIPKSKRMKDRVAQHGRIMQVKMVNSDGDVLLCSLGNTWRGETWLGWAKPAELDDIEAHLGQIEIRRPA